MQYSLTSDKIISEKDLKRLLKHSKKMKESAVASKMKEGYPAINDFYLFSICSSTGLRISELVALKWSDIFDDVLVVRKGKAGKKRSVLFGPKTRKLFEDFRITQQDIMERECQGNDHIFIGQRGPLTRHAVHFRFKKLIKEAGLSNLFLGVHSLRHSYATTCLDKGINLNTLKEQLGHSSLVVTSVYLHLSEKSKEEIARVF